MFVQTFKPDHYVLQHLQDLERFYGTELRLRATMRYPPFTRLVLIRLDGIDRKVVLHASDRLHVDDTVVDGAGEQPVRLRLEAGAVSVLASPAVGAAADGQVQTTALSDDESAHRALLVQGDCQSTA